MRIQTLAIPALAGLLIGAQPCFAQSQPGAGSPSHANGAPMAPNASVAPSMVPDGANMGTQAGAARNSGMMSADQGPSSQTAQPNTGMNRAHRAGRGMSGGVTGGAMGTGMTDDSTKTMTPSSPTPNATPPR